MFLCEAKSYDTWNVRGTVDHHILLRLLSHRAHAVIDMNILLQEARSRYCVNSRVCTRFVDVAFCDDEGDFWIFDRLKEIIKYKGFQVRNVMPLISIATGDVHLGFYICRG